MEVKHKINIVECIDPDKERVMADIKRKGLCTKYIGGIDDYAVYPNGYYTEIKGRRFELNLYCQGGNLINHPKGYLNHYLYGLSKEAKGLNERNNNP